MAVTAALIKELREMTGVGMSDCKAALVETDGDIDKAVEHLREKGLAAASKKAGRLASEGLVCAYITDDKKTGVVVEVNSETDFVAKNDLFKDYVLDVAKQAAASSTNDMDAFKTEKWLPDESVTVDEALNQKVAVIGENLTIRRFERFSAEDNSVFVSYVHGGGKVAVLLHLSCEKDDDAVQEFGRNISMQIAAMNPTFVSSDDVSQDFKDKEREILKTQALNENAESPKPKPEAVIEKMIEGRLNKNLKEICLLEQEYVKEDKMTIAEYVERTSKEFGTSLAVKSFIRFETGEGLEKKEENFAEEVSKAMGN